ncbi:MAG TPA: TonB family protein [Candidatus Sulfotelmatobacter sp.]
MAYQALLFCPDEKTARTVTQVLSELDFQVSPCTEPFAAVKKLMAERFDAVVVDCDNEQNATLLFKSARNAPNNSAALAVAVVEGQAGVAKAFRIGANLVLTKPINVEQAKGTLRVARGLLRKNESSKTAPTPAVPTKPASVASETLKAQGSPATSLARPSFSAPAAATSAPVPKLSASASSHVPVVEAKSDDEILPASPEPESTASTQRSAAKNSAPALESRVEEAPEAAVSKAQPLARASASPSVVAHGSAASAPARALEPKPVGSASSAKPTPGASRENADGVAKVESSADVVSEKTDAAVATPTFGVAETEAKPSGSGKKALIAVAAVVLIAVAGYWAWTQYAGAHATPVSSVQPAQHPIPAASPATQPSATPASTSPAISAAAPSPSLPVNAAAESESSNVVKTSAAPSDHGKESPQAHVDAVSASAFKASPVKSSDESAETVHPIMVKGGTEARISAKSQTDTAAPEIAGIATAQSGAGLSNLVSSSDEPAPVLQAMSVSQGVSQGLIIKKISPSYPANAERMRIEGQVELLATVSRKGDISAVKVLRGDPNLTRAAVDAVKQWKYKPYLLDGVPVEIQTQVTVNFKLPR